MAQDVALRTRRRSGPPRPKACEGRSCLPERAQACEGRSRPPEQAEALAGGDDVRHGTPPARQPRQPPRGVPRGTPGSGRTGQDRRSEGLPGHASRHPCDTGSPARAVVIRHSVTAERAPTADYAERGMSPASVRTHPSVLLCCCPPTQAAARPSDGGRYRGAVNRCRTRRWPSFRRRAGVAHRSPPLRSGSYSGTSDASDDCCRGWPVPLLSCAAGCATLALQEHERNKRPRSGEPWESESESFWPRGSPRPR
jgi:hypothetical protein